MISNRVASTAGFALLIISISAARFRPAHLSVSAESSQKTTCSLLSTSDASTALGETSQPGVPEFATGCVWSRESPARDTSRQLHVEFHTVRAYDIAKGGNAITKIEPVQGVGDDAFYQLYPNGATPFLWLKKGDKTISIRINTKRKDPPFTEAQLKSKLSVLGKAAVAKM
jgi:hypothetical protein